ncbi:MAG: oligoendopeptidase F [Spirochaetaceae bacterium]|jgi:oligoendopeptidase F|nr:oligoendopeptidase F [Spirochaetaceae bacterium]
MRNKEIPARSGAAKADTWDLSKLYADDAAWAAGLTEYKKMAERIPSFKGKLAEGGTLLAFMEFSRGFGILEERLAYYSELRQCEDEGANEGRAMTGRFLIAQAEAQTALAWANPEIQSIPDPLMSDFLDDGRFAEYRILLLRILRWKPYILSEKEERIIALHSEASQITGETFSVLTNVDIDFGTLETPGGTLPLSQSTWTVFMENPDRGLRERAYKQFYSSFEGHKTTLAALYGGSVKKDAIQARVRGFKSAREAALFPDNVDTAVYDNLIDTVTGNLVPLHRYYDLRRRLLMLDELRHWDVYAPIAGANKDAAFKRTDWNEAVDLISQALSPLGDEYVDTLRNGLLGRWADRYENKCKRSGAFSAGSFSGDPYILMNYKEDSIRDVFTLAHEGGHSMHSWYSARNNPFAHYRYAIFEAEVASTFNEELLYRYLRDTAATKDLKLYIVQKRADDILATLYRQTMFAEYEKRTHELEEGGTPLTADVLRSEYRLLLEKYFGPGMKLEAESDLEGLRIPHFYNAFYVYKYSTGISASLALAERVLSGGETERNDYFAFLKSGGSRFPIDSLKLAGVDMSDSAPVKAACGVFEKLVNDLETLLASPA